MSTSFTRIMCAEVCFFLSFFKVVLAVPTSCGS
jgi:hypothetical protein